MKLINLAYVAASALVPFVANATDLPSKKSAPALSTTATSDSWTGAYAGVNTGYSLGSSKVTNTASDFTDTVDGIDGAIGGVQLGYDYQMGSSVIGVVADYDFTKINGSKTVPYGEPPIDTTATIHAKSIATIRARFGYLLTNNLLAYVTGGLAFADYELGVSAVIESVPFEASQTSKATGFVVGAGAEYRIAKNLSTFAEYRFNKFDSVDFSDVIAKADFANNEIRFGVNYRF